MIQDMIYKHLKKICVVIACIIAVMIPFISRMNSEETKKNKEELKNAIYEYENLEQHVDNKNINDQLASATSTKNISKEVSIPCKCEVPESFSETIVCKFEDTKTLKTYELIFKKDDYQLFLKCPSSTYKVSGEFLKDNKKYDLECPKLLDTENLIKSNSVFNITVTDAIQTKDNTINKDNKDNNKENTTVNKDNQNKEMNTDKKSGFSEGKDLLKEQLKKSWFTLVVFIGIVVATYIVEKKNR